MYSSKEISCPANQQNQFNSVNSEKDFNTSPFWTEFSKQILVSAAMNSDNNFENTSAFELSQKEIHPSELEFKSDFDDPCEWKELEPELSMRNFVEAARSYRLFDDSLANLCSHNSLVATRLGI